MLSRLCRSTFELRSGLPKFQPIASVTTSSKDGSAAAATPAESGQRDLVNFPRRVRSEYAPPTRYLVVPESWFQFFYPKTGVTGPYMFFFGMGTWLLSKEHIVTEGLSHVAACILFFGYVNHKYGPAIAKWYNKEFDEDTKDFDQAQEDQKLNKQEEIKQLEDMKYPFSAVEEVMKAKRENVMFQQEAVYRERLMDVYTKVKKQLDYQVEMENTERRLLQKNLVDYVMSKVKGSITAEQEQNMMQMCINQLNTLSLKA